jgi:putative DNA primase/helicase
VLFNVLEVLSKDPHWAGVFGYDAFAYKETLLARPPYLAEEGPWTVRPLIDQDDSETSYWLQREYDLCASTTLIHEAIQTMAHRNPYHPVRDYLRGLQWDQQPRLETWLTTYCHAEDTPYTRAVGAKTLLSWVARVEEPGCKADCVTILQGAQGIGKSTTWEILAGKPWFSDTMPDIERKDAMEVLHGKWIVELGELAVMRRSEREAIKRFVSSPSDHFRPSYGRRAMTFPRQTIFAGTTNKDQFLQDETGGRRWWPVFIPQKCDLEALRRDRDQLFAEAFDRYQHGAQWYLTPDEDALAAAEQEDRFEVDPWEEPVLAHLEAVLKDGDPYVTTQDLLSRCLGLEVLAQQNQSHTKRLGAILRRHKWQGNKPVWIKTPAGEQKQIKAWKPPLVTAVTAETRNNTETGNAVIPYKNNSVTGVTGVTGILITGESKNEITVKNSESNSLHPIWKIPVTTGNKAKPVTDDPGGVPAPLTPLPATDCYPPPCPHTETVREPMPDGSSLVRCVACRRPVATSTQERS